MFPGATGYGCQGGYERQGLEETRVRRDRGDRRVERAERRSSKLEPRTTVLIPLTFPLPLALNLDGLLYQLDQRRFLSSVKKDEKNN